MSEKSTSNFESLNAESTHFLPKVISSEVLLGQMKQICILHDGYVYQLRITKLGKLILTK
ncbi:hemin uptake protein HemP [Polynucleobacter sp. VK25]|uniref:hemin uptake protein HemP n=1 Tax=Polynucleobacter sp. VK25 TaxID=1758398 RepID=UPI00203BA34C|nr:hemin uptake protein HemP [Polynucleobacter sp. VK25]